MGSFFEPNNDATWAKVKTAIENFLRQTWKNGFLVGVNPQESYFVKIDRTTMNQSDIDNGRLTVIIGIAPVKPGIHNYKNQPNNLLLN